MKKMDNPAEGAKWRFLKVRTALLLILVGAFAFAGSLLLGAFLGFPYPDASSEELARIELYKYIAIPVMLISTIVMIAGLILLLKVLLGSSFNAGNDSYLK